MQTVHGNRGGYQLAGDEIACGETEPRRDLGHRQRAFLLLAFPGAASGCRARPRFRRWRIHRAEGVRIDLDDAPPRFLRSAEWSLRRTVRRIRPRRRLCASSLGIGDARRESELNSRGSAARAMRSPNWYSDTCSPVNGAASPQVPVMAKFSSSRVRWISHAVAFRPAISGTKAATMMPLSQKQLEKAPGAAELRAMLALGWPLILTNLAQHSLDHERCDY